MHIRRGVGWALAAATGLVAGRAHASSMEVDVGAGVADYNRALQHETDAGPSWAAALTMLPITVLGLELDYTGSRINYDASKSNRGGVSGPIYQNGGAALLRANLATGAVRPFAFGGIGVSRLDFDSGAPFRDDTVGEIPAGLGLEVLLGPVNITGRFRYSWMFDNDASTTGNFPSNGTATITSNRNAFDRWAAMINLGANL